MKLGDALCIFAERDLTEMILYGYDQPRIDAIKAKIAAFKNFPPDQYFAGLMMEATQIKNQSVAAMSEVAEGIVRRAEIHFKKGSARAQSFGWTGYITQTDNSKVATCRLVLKMGTERLAELAAYGLTNALLLDLEAKISAATEAITAKQMSVAQRDLNVQERIILGNELYSELVNLAATGKHIWKNKNHAKHKCYIMYPNIPNMETVTGTVAPHMIHQPSVSVTSEENKIELILEKGKVMVYFSPDPTDPPAGGMPVVEVTPLKPLRTTAAQLKWSEENFRLLLKNDDATESAVFRVVVRG